MKIGLSHYDPNSAIAYESFVKKMNGPYGTGDAMNGGWAQTNLGFMVLHMWEYLVESLKQTNIEGVLQLGFAGDRLLSKQCLSNLPLL